MGEVEHSKMAASVLDSVTWEEIDLAESYLVSSMFEEAASLASSVLKCLHDNVNMYSENENVWQEMMESSAMVLVQSWGGTGRKSDLLKELEGYFELVTEVPVQVVLTSACVQVSGGQTSRVRDFLDVFLAEWELNNEKYYVITSQDVPRIEVIASTRHFTLEVDQYLKVAEFYALSLLGVVLNDVDHAVSWVEKAQLPEEARQDLLRRLLSLSPLKPSSSTDGVVSVSTTEESESRPLKEIKQSDKTLTVLSTQCHSGVDGRKHSIWIWLQNMARSSCNSVIATKGKIFLCCLIFLICYFIRKKRETVKRVVLMRLSSIKKALVDFWNLAFSYQVNPLAAVQPLPVSANRSRI